MRKNPRMRPPKSVLADGWQWSMLRERRVAKSGGARIAHHSGKLKYTGGRNFHQILTMRSEGYPYMKLILLTHMEDTVQSYIEDRAGE